MSRAGRLVRLLLLTALAFVPVLSASAGIFEETDRWPVSSPVGVATGPDGTVYVTDSLNNRVDALSPTGSLSYRFGSGTMLGVKGCAVDPIRGRVFVADRMLNRILAYNLTGARKLALEIPGVQTPDWIAVDPATGDVYVAQDVLVEVYSPETHVRLRELSSATTGRTFDSVVGVAVADGLVYLSERDRVDVYTTAGVFFRSWGLAGEGGAIAVADGRVAVTLPSSSRVQVFDLEGRELGLWGGAGPAVRQFLAPFGVSFDGSSFFIANNLDHRVIRYTLLDPPAVLGTTPDVVEAGSGRVPVSVHGSTFPSNSSVSIIGPGGASIPVTVLSCSADEIAGELDLTGEIPAGSYTATVVTPGGQSGTVVAAVQVRATVRSVSPTTVRPSSGIPELVVAGAGLSRVGEARFSDGAGTGWSATGIGVSSSAISIAPHETGPVTPRAGPVRLVLVDLDGRTVADLPSAFTILSSPSIDEITPGMLRAGRRTPFLIRGDGFLDGERTVVNLTRDGRTFSADLLRISTLEIEGNITVAADTQPGPWDVVVRNADGEEAILVEGIEVIPPLEILDITPSVGLSRERFMTFNLTGGGFGAVPGSVEVRLQRAGYENITWTEDSIRPDTLQGAFDLDGVSSGFRDVVVTAWDGAEAEVPDGFLVVSDPIVTRHAPADAYAGDPALAIEVGGEGFEGGARVDLVRSGYENRTMATDEVAWTRIEARGSTIGMDNGDWDVVVTNPDGREAVSPIPLRISSSSLGAAIRASSVRGEAPFTVQFTDASTGAVERRHWEFGDGATSDEACPEHTYPSPGTFTVRLTVSNRLRSATAAIPIVVEPRLQAAFAVHPQSGPAPLAVRCIDYSIGATAWSWDFGDGGISIEREPVHTYLRPGAYSVSLKVGDETGRADTSTQWQAVVVREAGPVLTPTPSPLPTPTVTPSPIPTNSSGGADPPMLADRTNGTVPLVVRFSDLSNATRREWTFGDGMHSHQRNVSHVYRRPGSYPVSLTVWYANGTGRAGLTISVEAPPSPSRRRLPAGPTIRRTALFPSVG
jgi:PKD repeat protein